MEMETRCEELLSPLKGSHLHMYDTGAHVSISPQYTLVH